MNQYDEKIFITLHILYYLYNLKKEHHIESLKI